jgi:hypothetical protein
LTVLGLELLVLFQRFGPFVFLGKVKKIPFGLFFYKNERIRPWVKALAIQCEHSGAVITPTTSKWDR